MAYGHVAVHEDHIKTQVGAATVWRVQHVAVRVKEVLDAFTAVPRDRDGMAQGLEHGLHHLHVEVVVLRDQYVGRPRAGLSVLRAVVLSV